MEAISDDIKSSKSLSSSANGPLRFIHTVTATAIFGHKNAVTMWTSPLVVIVPICDDNNWRHKNN